VPDELEPDSLRPDLDRYAPRTAHGSSLSPAIYAAAWARAGEPDRALDLFRLAARLDLDDLTGTTAAGLHVATFGGTWQALAHGFLGLRALPTALAVDPVLPASWDAVHMTVRFRGARVALQASHDELRVASDRPLRVQLIGDRTLPVGPAGRDLVVALDDAAAPS
jgi:trehalose/maltose hydrolase-like predicted phosphorylase